MEGIHTKKLVEEPGEAAIVREIFDMYEQPDTSYGDITRYYAEKGVQFYGKELIRSMLAQLLRNPVYVRADMDVYRFFRSHGTNIVSSPEQFDGIHGCYLYQGRDAQTDKLQNLKGHMLVVAPHEGLVSSEQWLNCRIKLMRNKTIQANRKAVNTWLAGKVKCGNCGYALMSIKIQSGKQYFIIAQPVFVLPYFFIFCTNFSTFLDIYTNLIVFLFKIHRKMVIVHFVFNNTLCRILPVNSN